MSIPRGPEFVQDSIGRALTPLGRDVDREWENVIRKVSKERLRQLARGLNLRLDLEDAKNKGLVNKFTNMC